jgi:two-component SAPR family response regulator
MDASHVVQVSDGWVELRVDDVWLDLAEFERAAVRRTPTEPASAPRPDAKRWAQAVELYRGDLLQGWYPDWCLEERERLRQIYLETLDALVAACESNHDVNAGVAYAVRAHHTDPARECTHRALMRLYCLSGDRAAAVRQYEQCEKILRTELGIEPDDETKALYRSIRSGHRQPPTPPASEEPLPTLRSRRGRL